jgi:phosphate:Na+ symporter
MLLLSILFNSLAGLGVFLYGMRIMSKSIQQTSNKKLKNFISKSTNNPFLALIIGIIITLVTQSSSITTVMVVGFVDATLMTLKQAIGIILGANIGTTITGWILALKIGKYGFIIFGVFALVFLFSKNYKLKNIAKIFMAFGLIFIGLEYMKESIIPIKNSTNFIKLFQLFNASNYFGVILSIFLGAFLTAILQASAATIGVTIALASQNLITPYTAIALVLGENIGTTITAYLASLGASKNAKSTAYSHILIKIIGVAVIIPLFYIYSNFINYISPFSNGIKYIPLAHTIFNVTNSLIFIPFIPKFILLLNKFIKINENEKKSTIIQKKLFESPFIILEKSNIQLKKMNKLFLNSLNNYNLLLNNKDLKLLDIILKNEKKLDTLEEKQNILLTSFVNYNPYDNSIIDIQYYLRLSSILESMGDYIASLGKITQKAYNNKINFSESQIHKINSIHKKV